MVHEENISWKCVDFDKIFSNEKHLDKHLGEHLNENAYEINEKQWKFIEIIENT